MHQIAASKALISFQMLLAFSQVVKIPNKFTQFDRNKESLQVG